MVSLVLQGTDIIHDFRRWTLLSGFGHRDNHEIKGHTVEVDKIFKDAIRETSKSKEEEQQWLNDASLIARKDAIVALVALVLPYLTRLELLKVRLDDDPSVSYISRVFQRASHREKPFDYQPAFKHLLNVQLAPRGSNIATGSQSIASSFHFQDIKVVYGYHIGSPEGELKTLGSRFSSVTHLTLEACSFSTLSLRQLLQAAVALKTFIYAISETGTGTGIYDHIDKFQDIIDALQTQKDHLENLWLETRSESMEDELGFDEDVDNIRPISSFTSFKQLKLLRIQLDMIHGLDQCFSYRGANINKDEEEGYHGLISFFPPTIEILHFTLYRNELRHGPKSRYTVNMPFLIGALQQLLLHQSPKEVPALHTIIIEASIPHPPGLLRGLKRLIKQGKALGVLIFYVGLHDDDDGDDSDDDDDDDDDNDDYNLDSYDLNSLSLWDRSQYIKLHSVIQNSKQSRRQWRERKAWDDWESVKACSYR